MNTLHALTLAGLLMAAPLSATWAAGPNAAPARASSVLSGEVLEVQDVDAYTYLRLKTKDGETWAAVSKVALKKGAKVTLEDTMVMDNFESKSLKKTFKTIVFGTLVGGPNMMTGAQAKAVDLGPIQVAKASGANARTVAEVVTQAAALKDKPVKVSGKVVKFNGDIMGKNWLHLQDGSGSAAAKTNDILVTSAAQAKVGDVVTVTGVVRKDKDFGAGYSYQVLIEDATLTRP